MKYIVVLIIILSCVLSLRYYIYFKNRVVYKEGDKIELYYTFLDEPKKSSRFQTFSVDGILIQTPLYPEFNYGNTVKLYGIISSFEFGTSSKITKNSKDSNQALKNKTILTVKNPKIELNKQRENIFLSLAKFIRQKTDQNFNSILVHDQAGLLLGIVLGEKQGISKQFYEKLIKTGVVHVVAASGMNVTMFGGFLMSILIYIVNRRIGIAISLFMIALYALASGLSPSIIRASLMGSTLLIGQLYGRQTIGFFSLFLTACIMLLFSPVLLFDMGFQLSFASTSGILFIKPVFDKLKSFKFGVLKLIREDLTTSLAAQIATIPIILAVFSTYNPLSLIVNLLVLWTIPALMLFGGIGTLLGLLLPVLSVPFLFLSYPLLSYFIYVVNLFSSLSSPIEVGRIPTFLWLSYYLILISLTLFLANKKHETVSKN